MKNKNLYEVCHQKSKSQFKIVSNNNFTYVNILSILNFHLNKRIKRILDVGCGSGTVSFYLASKGYEVKGIDISRKAIDVCKESAKKLGLRNTNFGVCNFPKETPKGLYDFIFFSEVVEHLPDDEMALRKIYNLLKPNGTLFLSTPSKNAPLYRIGYANKFDQEVGHLRRYTIEEINDKLIKVGFKIKKVYKREGVLRNFLFLNKIAGKLIRFIKFFVVPVFTSVDRFLVSIFGESQIIVIAYKT